MPDLFTPGDRLRYFAGAFFRSVSEFARCLGYSRPGSLYDYFSNAKQPGVQFQDRFLQAGGNPAWLRYGTGGMFADNDAGRELHRRFGSADTAPQQSPPASLVAYRIPASSTEEELYLLMNSVFFKMRTRDRVAADVLQLYKQVLDNIRTEIARMESDRDVLTRLTEKFDDPPA